MRRTKLIFTVCCALACSAAFAGDIPERPEGLEFPDLSFTVPDANGLRFELSNGVPVYAKQDREFPLVNLQIIFKGGKYIEPEGKAGLVALASEVWRTGGAGELSAQELDEELDFLAASMSTRISDVTGSASMNVLSKDLGKALPMLMDVLLRPRFQEDRFAKAKDDLIQDLKTRNDSTARVESREWERLLFGDDYWSNRLATKASIDAITADDCRSFVTELIKAGNVVVAVSGDFDTSVLRQQLEASFGQLAKISSPLPAVPQPDHSPEPGVYMINKPDVNQGRVRIGHVGYREGHTDQFNLLLMNEILGGGAFTSRITKKVRSDEGLAYSAYSTISFPLTVPGTFMAVFQSKSSTCAYAAELSIDIIREIREAPVGSDEMDVSRASFIETFPRRFESAARTVSLFATGELLGREAGYWKNYRTNMGAVSASDIQAAAKKNIDPDKMVILVVGNSEEILAGHPEHDAKMTDFGPIHMVPLRDPLTLEPLTEE